MNLDHLIGLQRSVEITVDDKVTASSVGSGGVDVLSTPSMILLFEQTARDAVQSALPEGFTTVGTRVDIRHISATPVGERVRAGASVMEVTGRRILFAVSASDRHGTVGAGTHERYVVDIVGFMEKLVEKYSDRIGK
ncbi:MAG: thioesterase family protein [Candidatus Fermentibacteraceae bacterium]|nr:thioesterase family protein [Candidatus Fermentibacteraceae bacterium]MBN2609127.1 thioesterase family protein [Candidatus Fermentibacteraceae bacterium]